MTSHAKTLACQILNMSPSDFQQMMSGPDATDGGGGDGHNVVDHLIEGYLSERLKAEQNDELWKENVQQITKVSCCCRDGPASVGSTCVMFWGKWRNF